MPRRAVLLIAILVLTAAPIAHAQTSRPAYTVDKTFDISGNILDPITGYYLRDTNVSPDLHTILITQSAVPTINIYRLLSSRRMDIAGIFLLLITLLFFRRSLRLWRIRHLVNQPYCHRCRYQLTGIDSPQCPECGTPLTPKTRRIGRPVRARLLFTFTLLAISWTTWFITRAYYPASYFMEWHGPSLYSDALAQFAVRHQIGWLQPYVTPTVTLEQWTDDVKIGQLLRCPWTGAFGDPVIIFSPDSQHAYLTMEGNSTTLAAIIEFDLRIGHIARTFTAPSGLTIYFSTQSPPWISGNTLKWQAGDMGSYILQWNLATGQSLKTIHLADQASYGIADRGPGKGYVSLSGGQSPVIFDADGAIVQQLPPDEDFSHLNPPYLITRDGNAFFIPEAPNTVDGVHRWDLKSATYIRTIFPNGAFDLMLTPNDMRLITYGGNDANYFDVYDAATCQFLRRITFPELKGTIVAITIAPDNRHAVIVGNHILRIDLHDTLTAPTPTPTTAPAVPQSPDP